jgi:predicted Zn-dependent peptidase
MKSRFTSIFLRQQFLKTAFVLSLCFTVLSCSFFKRADEGIDLRDQVEKITLDNGVRILLLKREGAPVFSVISRFMVAAMDEKEGESGLAHFFEHMAFKGTDQIGTIDFNQEKEWLDQVHETGTTLVRLKKEGKTEEVKLVSDLLQTFQTKQKEYEVPYEYTRIMRENGGVGLNATTSQDFTSYFVSLPSQQLELWARMETDRFTRLVLRGFFSEVEVIKEERKMRLENSPFGRLFNEFKQLAFAKSPYRLPVIGKVEDINAYTPEKARKFYKEMYKTDKLVIAIVGNFDKEEAKAIVKKYFSKLPANLSDKTVQKPSTTKYQKLKHKVIKSVHEPRFVFGFHRPSDLHEDSDSFHVIQMLLCGGKTSRLYKKLVLEEQKAAKFSCYASEPGARLDSLFVFTGSPLPGVSNQEIFQLALKEIDLFKKEGPTKEELDIVKTKIDASLVYGMKSSMSLAESLSYYELLFNDWTAMYEKRDHIRELTAEDIKKVADQYFVYERQVSAFLEKE